MASVDVVTKCLRAMWAASHPGTKLDEETEKQIVALFAPQLVNRTDDSVKLAANEWAATMKFFPKPIEFIELARKHHDRMDDAQRALSPATEAVQRYPIGKKGMEGVATQIVLQRMFDAVAREAPDGYLGRARGLRSENVAPGMHRGLRDLGHEFNDRGLHAKSCARCHALATIAYEQAVDFEGSTLSWDRW